jgi:hypothetical protein
LDEDYHALIRRYQFNVKGTKIQVHREVLPIAHPTAMGESFIEGFTSTPQPSTSFDEPLASALSVGIDHTPPTATIPMLPNGTPGSRPSSMSFVSSMPIRSVTEGMSESLVRIKREMHRARSPRSSNDSRVERQGGVPLEFDEEDEEDFLVSRAGLVDDDGSNSAASRNGHDSIAVSTPVTTALELEDDDVIVDDSGWRGWEPEEAERVVEDVERFDDISVVGFLEEEQEEIIKAQKEQREKEQLQQQAPVGGKRKKGKKGR